jgi:uncharacterized protein DUF6916
MDSLADLTLDAFRLRIGERFRIQSAAQTIDAELIDARAVGEARAPKRTPFAVLFRTALTAPLPQAIYRVEHDEMGAHDIFLVPVGPDAAGMVYEAIFT